MLLNNRFSRAKERTKFSVRYDDNNKNNDKNSKRSSCPPSLSLSLFPENETVSAKEMHETLTAEKERVESKCKSLRAVEKIQSSSSSTSSSPMQKNNNEHDDDYDTEKQLLHSNYSSPINTSQDSYNNNNNNPYNPFIPMKQNNTNKSTNTNNMTCYQNIQQHVYWTIADPPEGHKLGECVTALILLLITANVIVGALETEEHLYEKHEDFFYYFELVSVIIFTVEYTLTIWSITFNGEQHPFFGRIKAMLRPLSIIDLLSIAPFYLNLALPDGVVDLRFLRTLRLFRLFRLFRHGKMREGFSTLSQVVISQREQLTLGMYLLTLSVLLFSSIMFIIESGSKFAATTKFTSIPATMWWGVVTMTTIGYGDMYPESTGGKIFASLVGYVGICIIALPVGIIGSGFTEYMNEKKKRDEILKKNQKKLMNSTRTMIRMQQSRKQLERLQIALNSIEQAMTVLEESMIVDDDVDEETNKLLERAPKTTTTTTTLSPKSQHKLSLCNIVEETDTDTNGSSSISKREEIVPFNNTIDGSNKKNDVEVCSCPHCGRLYL